MDCKEARAYLTPALDNELPMPDSARLSEHLATCENCRSDWNASLKLREGIRQLIQAIPENDSLETELLKNLRSAVTPKQRTGPLSMRFAIAAALIACICCGLFFYRSTLGSPIAVEALVKATSHGSNEKKAGLFHVEGQLDGSLDQAATVLGTAIVTSNLHPFHVSSVEVIADKQNRRAVRLCYTVDTGDSLCIDCYQAPAGLLSFSGEVMQAGDGRTVHYATMAGENVVMFSKQGKDIVYASALPKEKLLALVLPNIAS